MLDEVGVRLKQTVINAGAEIFVIEEDSVEEGLSPLLTIMPLNFLTHYLAEAMGVKGTFTVGAKVTEVE